MSRGREQFNIRISVEYRSVPYPLEGGKHRVPESLVYQRVEEVVSCVRLQSDIWLKVRRITQAPCRDLPGFVCGQKHAGGSSSGGASVAGG